MNEPLSILHHLRFMGDEILPVDKYAHMPH